mmetsp:Transcript_15165/g.33919  ORF Transcript_15165/g.33919 Transcript_15165/m.33919 type:complete len:83 (-) Transcript_15165:584-832(-)
MWRMRRAKWTYHRLSQPTNPMATRTLPAGATTTSPTPAAATTGLATVAAAVAIVRLLPRAGSARSRPASGDEGGARRDETAK